MNRLAIILISIMTFAPQLLQAKEFQIDSEVKISQSEKLTIMASPSLHKKKVSTVKIFYTGSKSFKLISFDAEMPNHNHGMIVKPAAPKMVQGEMKTYSIDGIKLHMPGDWVLIIKAKIDGSLKEIRHPFKAKP